MTCKHFAVGTRPQADSRLVKCTRRSLGRPETSAASTVYARSNTQQGRSTALTRKLSIATSALSKLVATGLLLWQFVRPYSKPLIQKTMGEAILPLAQTF